MIFAQKSDPSHIFWLRGLCWIEEGELAVGRTRTNLKMTSTCLSCDILTAFSPVE